MEVSTVAAEDAALHKYKAAASCSGSTYLPCQLTALQDLQADTELAEEAMGTSTLNKERGSPAQGHGIAADYLG